MSEEFDLLNVTVHRVQVDNVVIKVPKGWRPVSTSKEFTEVITQVEKLRPDSAKTWRLEKGERVFADPRWRVIDPAGIPYHIDAREIIAKMPRGYDPEELRELQAEGAKAWAGVPDAAQWVRDLRGGNL